MSLFRFQLTVILFLIVFFLTYLAMDLWWSSIFINSNSNNEEVVVDENAAEQEIWKYTNDDFEDFADYVDNVTEQSHDNTINEILKICGDPCDTKLSWKPSSEWKMMADMPTIHKDFQCGNLFLLMDRLNQGLSELPNTKSLDEFSYGGSIKIKTDDSEKEDEDIGYNKEILWTYDYLQRQLHAYSTNDILRIDVPFPDPYKLQHYMKFVEMRVELNNKNILVLNPDEEPWIEILALGQGALNVTTIRDSNFKSQHVNLTVINWKDLASSFLTNNEIGFRYYDVVLIIDGFGEYSGVFSRNQMIHPWIDLITMARIWCLTKFDGYALVSVPINSEDVMIMDSKKIYGPKSLPQLFSNWDIDWSENIELDYFPLDKKYNPIVVLKKPST